MMYLISLLVNYLRLLFRHLHKSPHDEDKQSPHASDKQSPHQIIELQHFLHEHLLYGDKADDEEYEHLQCSLCDYIISSGDCMFSCKECKFLVHKSCGEAPRYIHNSLHPMHPLELLLLEKKPIPEYEYISCRCCLSLITRFGYSCSSSTTTVCDFNLDMECATKNIFDPKNHQHSFILFKPTLFTCDACGIDEDTKCLSHICSICQIQVHLTCHEDFPLSRRVRQRLHSHQLKLCYSFEFDFSNKLCKVCSKKMNNVLCLYQCNKGCAYIAHVSCATSIYYLIENIDHEEEDEVELEEIYTEPKEVITHFSHPHSLILSNIEPTYEAGCVCYGCVRPIISAPFYTCDGEKCNFFRHKQCSQLPKTIQSPIHNHPLVLKDFLDLYSGDTIFRGFTCDACQVRCNGFAYECTQYCEKLFDVGCTLFGDTLNHASHKCTLTLVSTIPNEENRCIACDSTFSAAFWCEKCNFFLDLKCASLPITIGHDCPTGTVWTVKPLKLTYDCIEHVGGQYYCDLCEETRGKDLWFYYCEDCHESIHPQCVLGDDRFKYGNSYNMDGHCHTVCVAKKPKTDPLCDTCGEPCQHSPLVFCPTCKVYFHDDLKCCGMSGKSRYEPIRNYCCGVQSSPNDDDDDDDDDDEEEEEDDGEIVVEQFNHFGHPHDLIMGDYDPERLYDEVCDGCGMKISGSFYRCGDKKGKCNFFLHRKCFELPKQIQHPLHPHHPLVLNSFLDLPFNGEVGFTCYGCDAFSNRFFYTCLACKFFLDVHCSLLSGTIVHQTHPSCTLTLIDKKIEMAKGERKCKGCNSDCSSSHKYTCDECNFQLCLGCVLLPNVVMRHHCGNFGYMHLLCLVYLAVIEDQDGSGHVYYCATCSAPIGENELRYYCRRCDSLTHVCCTDTVRRGLIKSGIVYQAYNHFHNLITIQDSRCCVVCDEEFKKTAHSSQGCVVCNRKKGKSPLPFIVRYAMFMYM